MGTSKAELIERLNKLKNGKADIKLAIKNILMGKAQSYGIRLGTRPSTICPSPNLQDGYCRRRSMSSASTIAMAGDNIGTSCRDETVVRHSTYPIVETVSSMTLIMDASHSSKVYGTANEVRLKNIAFQ